MPRKSPEPTARLARAFERARTNGTCHIEGLAIDDNPKLLGYSMSGHYTIPELEAILDDLRKIQAEYDAIGARRLAPATLAKCECEHDCHFHDGDMPQHAYGAQSAGVEPIKTPFATLKACPWCRDNCLAIYG